MKRRRLDDDHRKDNKETEITEPQQIHTKHIPIDVTAAILSRLPIKSIGRFISVSKSWRDVITGRRFSSLHAKNSPFSTFYNFSPRSGYDSQSKSKHCALEVDEDGNYTMTNFRPRIDDETSGGFKFVGTCNGLLCLLESRSGSDAITVLNPITNERTVVTLPTHKYCTRGSNGEEHHWADEFHKFCYSPSTDEYKVFKHVMLYFRGVEFRGAYAIFTVGVDRRWRELSPLLFSDEVLRRGGEGVFCDGALHWLADRGDPNSNHILAFDIARESTRSMPIRQRIEWDTRLSVFENRVSLYSHRLEGPDRGIVVWDTEGSWSRVVVPTCFRVPIRDDQCGEEAFKPLDCATKHGGVLLAGRYFRQTWLYCPKQERYTKIELVRVCRSRLFEFTPTFSSIEQVLHGGKSSKQCVD